MPGIIDFIAGLAQGGNNPTTGQPNTTGERLMNGVKAGDEGFFKENNDYQADASKAKALRQVVTAYAQDEPDPDKQQNVVNFAHTASLGDLEGYVQGHVNKMTAAKQAADIQEQQGRGEYYKSFAGLKDQMAQNDKAGGAFMSDFMTTPDYPDPDTGEERPPTMDERMKYAGSRNTSLGISNLGTVMDSMARYRQAETAQSTAAVKNDLATKPEELQTMEDAGGNKYDVIINPRTGKPTLMPQKTNGPIPDPPEGNPGKGMQWEWQGTKLGYIPKPIPKEGAGEVFKDIMVGGGATNAPAATPVMRFRKNAAGKIEPY